MANRRDETLAVLQQLGLTRDEAEEEISYREAEAERLLDEADEGDRAEVAKQARAHLFASMPFYVVPRRRPAATSVSARASRSAGATPAAASQPAPVSLTATEVKAPTDLPVAAATEATLAPVDSEVADKPTPAVTNALRSMAIAVASSKRVIMPPSHTNGNGSAAKADEPLGLRLPRTPVAAAQNGGLRARVETPVVEPPPLETPPPTVAATSATPGVEVPASEVAETRPGDITEIATPASPEVATLPPSTTMTANGSSSETGTAAEAEAQPSSAPSSDVAELPVAIDSPVAATTNGQSPASSAGSTALAGPAVDATAVGADTSIEPIPNASTAEAASAQPAGEATTLPTDAKVEPPTAQLPLAAVATAAEVAAIVAAPEAAAAVTAPGQKPARLSRKKRRELAAAEAALAAANNPQPATKPGGFLGPFKRYSRWTLHGPKWHFAVGLATPLLAVVLLATAAFGQTQGWYSSAGPAKSSGTHILDPALSNKAYTNYVLAMDATLDVYSTSVDTINRIANQPLSSNPGWAGQLNGAAVAIEDAGQNLRKVGVPLCVADSHHTFMVGVTNMDNAADNLIMGLRNSNPDNLTSAASQINSAKPLLKQASDEIKATKC